VKLLSLVLMFACTLSTNATQAMSEEPASALLPPVNQSVHYQYADTTTTPKGTKYQAGTLTLTAVAENEIQATITVQGRGSHTQNFLVDQSGGLQPAAAAEPVPSRSNNGGGSAQAERRAAEQALLFRLSIASRIGAHMGAETSFPLQLNVPWASGPVNPILTIKWTEPAAFVGVASDNTSVNPIQQKSKMSRHLLLPLGLGLAGGAIGGTPGRIVAAGGAAISVVTVVTAIRASSGPLPADVTVHVSGQLAQGRLRALSGDQEEVVHQGKKTHTFSDKWSLVAQ
jgi:hypothetical protein